MKTKVKTTKYILWQDVCDELNDLLGTNDVFYDFNGRDLHYYTWCEKKSYKKFGQSVEEQHKYYKEYREAIDGEQAKPEYQNAVEFMHPDNSFRGELVFNRNMINQKNPKWFNELIKLVCDKYENCFKNKVVIIRDEDFYGRF